MKTIRIGMVGAGWMGRSHAAAFRNARHVFRANSVAAELEVVADINLDSARFLAESVGCRRWTSDWRHVVNDRRVDAVDITTPNDTHFPIAMAAISAGKHVYCEKPLTITAPEAAELVAAANKAGVITLVGFNYLKNPAQALALDIIRSGELGDILSFRGVRDGDAAADPDSPFTWRHDAKIAGAGVLGDMGCHVVSLAHMLVGEIGEVFGTTKTFIKTRPVSVGGSGFAARADLSQRREVENEDTAIALLRFGNGALGSISCSRIAVGRKAWLAYEIHGTKGALFFTQQRMNELQLCNSSEPQGQRGFKTIRIGPEHGCYKAFHSDIAMGLGYNDLKVIEVQELVDAIAQKKRTTHDFSFAHKVAQVADAILLSSKKGQWVSVRHM